MRSLMALLLLSSSLAAQDNAPLFGAVPVAAHRAPPQGHARGRGSGQPGMYLVFLRRLHFDELPSGGLLDIRGKVIGKLRDQTRVALDEAKTVSERAYANAPTSPR